MATEPAAAPVASATAVAADIRDPAVLVAPSTAFRETDAVIESSGAVDWPNRWDHVNRILDRLGGGGSAETQDDDGDENLEDAQTASEKVS